MRSTVGSTGEALLIRMIRRWVHRQSRHPVVLRGIGDDCATLRTAARTLVSVDAFVEGVHFKRTWT